MSYPLVYHWEPLVGNEATIANIQTVGVGEYFVLNTNSTTSIISAVLPPLNMKAIGVYTYDKIARNIMLSSADDNSATTFVIAGIGAPVDVNGNPTQQFGEITERITVGPTGAAPVFSENIYRTIIFVAVLVAEATNVSVGFGKQGITDYYLCDYNRIIHQTTAQIRVNNRTNLLSTTYTSLDRPEIPNSNGSFDSPVFPLTYFPVVNLGAVDTDSLGFIVYPVSTIWTAITNADEDDELWFTLLQQGIK